MPPARPPVAPQKPCVLSAELSDFIRCSAKRVFGEGASVRNYGTNADALRIHIEADGFHPLKSNELAGVLMTRLDHVPHIEVTQRGIRPRGDAKIAYRQGQVL